MNIMKDKFQGDVIFNLASILIMGISAILINIIIGAFYGARDLGIFNQIYAIYIFGSQLSVIGLPPSVVKHVAQYSDDKDTVDTIIFTGLSMAAVLGSIVCLIIGISHSAIGRMLDSSGVSSGLFWASPGLFFFSINKVLLASINGLEKMKLYAVLQSGRYILMIVSLFILTFIDWPGQDLAVIFTFSEFILFIGLLIVLSNNIRLPSGQIKVWIKRHFLFGIKSFVNALLLELNTRVDVLMLGVFCSDYIVGIYSFAAMLAEGFSQLLGAVMRVVTPKLVRFWTNSDQSALTKFKKNIMKQTYKWSISLGGIIVMAYPLWIHIVAPRAEFEQSWLTFSILSMGILMASGYIPFRNILQAAGYPGWQSIQTIILVGINISANLILIPAWGMHGAAVGTTISMVSIVFILKWMSAWKLDYKL